MRSIIYGTSINTDMDLLKSANVGILRGGEGLIIGGINPPIIEFKDDINDSGNVGTDDGVVFVIAGISVAGVTPIGIVLGGLKLTIATSACSYVQPHLSRHL